MKKHLAFLLALHVLLLTFVPCVDETLGCSEIQHISGSSASSAQNSEQHDNCSPFCTCSCCNIAMEVTMPLFFSFSASIPQPINYSFIVPLISQFVITIWEPPKA